MDKVAAKIPEFPDFPPGSHSTASVADIINMGASSVEQC